MPTTILILICAATVITTIVNFAKPAYEEFAGKYAVTINIILSFILWIVWAFSVEPYISYELADIAVVLLWLAIGTWATVFYDLLKLIQNLWATKDLNNKESM